MSITLLGVSSAAGPTLARRSSGDISHSDDQADDQQACEESRRHHSSSVYGVDEEVSSSVWCDKRNDGWSRGWERI